MVLLPGARIAPATSTWTCCQTFFENSGANRVKTRIIWAGRVRISITSFLADCGEERTLPFPVTNGQSPASETVRKVSDASATHPLRATETVFSVHFGLRIPAKSAVGALLLLFSDSFSRQPITLHDEGATDLHLVLNPILLMPHEAGLSIYQP